MPKGAPLTPGQVETIARVYAETGNASEAARQAGCSADAAERCVARSAARHRAELYDRARDEGIRKAAESLDRGVTLVARMLGDDGNGLAPRDVAALLRSVASLSAELRAVAEHRSRASLARLTREKTRAEIALLHRRISGEHVERVALEHLSDAELDARLATLFPHRDEVAPIASA